MSRGRASTWLATSIVAMTTLLALATPTSAVTQPSGDATATVETTPVLSTGDAADDPAIWVHPTDPAQSVVIGNDKGGALEVYGLDGVRIQRIAEGFFGNVDVRRAVPLGDGVADLVGTLRNGLRFYRIDPATRMLTNATEGGSSIPTGIGGEGYCLYRSPLNGQHYAFVVARDGRMGQFRLGDADADGLVDVTTVRTWDVGTEAEGCVADDGLGALYVSEEDVGIWRYDAEPSGSTAPADRVSVDTTTARGGRLLPDVEGLTIVYQPDGTGYLLASSQAASNTNNFYAVYEREGSNAFVRNFKTVTGASADGCGRTDGIDALAADLGPAFPNGLFVCQDNANTAPGTTGRQNFKLVPLERVVGLDTAPPPNRPPTASFIVSCTGLSCDVDGAGSTDPEGAALRYAWDFGDGATADGMTATHSFAEDGTYPVTLTVTDPEGLVGTASRAVRVGAATADPIAFRAAARYVGNTTRPALVVPASVQPGDGLLLFATVNVTSTVVTGPSGVTGWTQIANVVSGSARTLAWARVAGPDDAARTASLSFSRSTKVAMNLLAYDGTSSTGPVAASATRSQPQSSSSHSTPAVDVATPGAWVLSYWADKSATTTNWSAPAEVTVRDEVFGTGSGRISALLADSGAAVPTGTAPSRTATTNAPSPLSTTMSLVLAPG